MTFSFYSHHSLMLVREAPIRWWNGSTSLPLKLGATSGTMALSPSLVSFQRSPRVLPCCSASLRGGGILPTPFTFPSGSWRWLPMTFTSWPALVSKGPSSVWMACRVYCRALTCWRGSTLLRPFATSTWYQITCFSHRELWRSMSVWLGLSFSTC